MPTPVKQRPGGNGPASRIPARAGSVLSRAVPVQELEAVLIKMLIYGQNGVGKTTLACTFPKPLLIVSFEPASTGGALSVRRMPGVHYLRITSTTEERQLLDELRGENLFKTHVVDSVTSYQDMKLQEIIGKPLPAQLNFGAVSGDQYRERAEVTKQGLRDWANLGSHTVFIGKEKDHNPPKEERVNERTGKTQPDMRPRFLRGMQPESFVSVDLGGGTAGWLQDACDYVGRLYMDREMERVVSQMQGREVVNAVETGRFIRALRISYHPNFMSRFRSDQPDKLPEAIPNPTFDKILAAIEGRYKE